MSGLSRRCTSRSEKRETFRTYQNGYNVWHASGQSNMEWFANKSNCLPMAAEMAKATVEVPIRELRTDTVSALYPQEKVASEAGWKTSRKSTDFSALALAFANELHKELKVPIGILLTSHSNTRVEAFTERKAIEAHPGLKLDAAMIHDGDVGTVNPDELGMAEVRQAQHLFFMNNRDDVGMVVQTDLNPAATGAIHYVNKLHPGMRLARWALAKDYGRDIAHTGPIYQKCAVEGNKAVVSFEKESLFGGLMVGSKGLEQDMKEPGRFVEPALPTPGENSITSVCVARIANGMPPRPSSAATPWW